MASGNQGYDVCSDTIFVTGLPEDTTSEQLAEYFGQIGIIKFDKKNDCKKIWIYKDKATGKGKGEATITYDDPPTATSAIQWFDGKYRMQQIVVEPKVSAECHCCHHSLTVQFVNPNLNLIQNHQAKNSEAQN
jgi:RNA recognition motif-containing protein